MKKITIALMALLSFSFTGMAQEDKKDDESAKVEKPGKKETQEIIIRKSGDKEIKLKVEIDGDKVTINGKPMSEFKDDNVTVNKRKMIITDGEGMNWSFGGEGDWEKWGENFGKNFERNWNFNGEGENDDAAFLGVTTEKVDDGAKIVEVSKGSAAEKAGLKKDDIITKVDDEKISGPDVLSDVIGFKKPDDEVKIKYKRAGKENSLKVALGKRKERKSYGFNGPNGNFRMFTFPAPPTPPHTNMEGFNEDLIEMQQDAIEKAFPSRKKIGLKIQDVEDGNGVKVINVEDSSAAATAGLKKDDIITEINGKKINNTDDAREELVPDEDKKLYKIKANRGGSEMNFDVKIPRKLKTANL